MQDLRPRLGFRTESFGMNQGNSLTGNYRNQYVSQLLMDKASILAKKSRYHYQRPTSLVLAQLAVNKTLQLHYEKPY